MAKNINYNESNIGKTRVKENNTHLPNKGVFKVIVIEKISKER